MYLIVLGLQKVSLKKKPECLWKIGEGEEEEEEQSKRDFLCIFFFLFVRLVRSFWEYSGWLKI